MIPGFGAELEAVLKRLHVAAEQDQDRWAERSGTTDPAANSAGSGPLVRLGEFYLSVSPDEGKLLYVLARAIGARRIVEFGASYGISSIYLGAAARENGGKLVTTEVHPDKCAVLRQTFAEAGLTDAIELREGDAMETLSDFEGPVDLLFLDGWKSGYLPIYQLLRPALRPGALILADNCSHPAAANYVAEVTSGSSGCVTAIKGDLSITYVSG